MDEYKLEKILEGLYGTTCKNMSSRVILTIVRETGNLIPEDEEDSLECNCAELLNSFQEFSLSIKADDDEEYVLSKVSNFMTKKVLDISSVYDFIPTEKLIKELTIDINTFLYTVKIIQERNE